MSRTFARLLLVALIAVMMPACAVVGAIFKAGVAVGILMAIFVVAVIFFLVTRTRA
jgi:hypothetical protein